MVATRLLLGATLVIGGMTACNDDEDTATAPVVNTNTVVVSPRVSSLRVGQTQQLAATVLDKTGATVAAGAVTWTSVEPTIATVSATGLVTMLTTGSTAIQATIGGVTGIASLQGVAGVASISIAGLTRAVAVGEQVPLSFRTLDAAGNALVARAVTWSSSAPTVATVNADGVIAGVAPGAAVVTATSEGRTATVNVVVEALAPVNTVTLSPTTQTLAAGSTQQLVATLRDANSNVLANRPITWASSSAATGSVSSTGLVSALVPGTFTVTATSEGRSGSLTFNPLLSNTPLTIAGPLNSAYSWFITVPAGATGLTVTLAGTGTQDPDLEVYRPGTTTAACVSEAAGPTESCTFTTAVSAGEWRVRVIGYTAYAGVTLRAVVTP
jgi:trimeric autotransporter adhesin